MTRNLYWIIALLICLIVGIGLYLKNSEKAFDNSKEIEANLIQSNRIIKSNNESLIKEMNDDYREIGNVSILDLGIKCKMISDSFIDYLDELKTDISYSKSKDNNHTGKRQKALSESWIMDLLLKKDKIFKSMYQIASNDSLRHIVFKNNFKPTNHRFLEQNRDEALKLESQSFEIRNKQSFNIFLTQIQNECRLLEYQILNFLRREEGRGKTTTWCGLGAMVMAPSSTVLVGQEYKAQIFLIPKIKENISSITVDGKKIPVECNFGNYFAVPKSPGFYEFRGVIKTDEYNEFKYYPFNISYQAFSEKPVILLTSPKIFYVGIDNPIDITTPGYKPEDVLYKISNGELIKKENWVVNVSKVGKTVLTILGKSADDSYIKLGEETFLVRNLPVPESSFGNLKSGEYKVMELLKQNAIIANLDNKISSKLKIEIKQYKVLFYTRNGTLEEIVGQGATLSQKVKNRISLSRVGDRIIIDEIMSTGQIRLTPIVLTVL